MGYFYKIVRTISRNNYSKIRCLLQWKMTSIDKISLALFMCSNYNK